MTNHSPATPMVSGRLIWMAIAALTTTLAALTAKLVLPELPPELIYTKGFAPWWTTLFGVFLGGAAVLAMATQQPRHRQAIVVTGSVATALLLWSSAGVVLDAFRAFFAITGIPAGNFSVVDWPGTTCRAVSMVCCGVLALMTVRAIRQGAVTCLECGRSATRNAGRYWHGLAAALLGLPYPLLKVYWWADGTVLRPQPFDQGFPVLEVVLGSAGLLLSLALVQRWGRVFPRWMPLTSGVVATAMLISMGGLSVFGTLSQLAGITDGPVSFDAESLWTVGVVYGSWALFGLALLGATAYYAHITARLCPRCPPR